VGSSSKLLIPVLFKGEKEEEETPREATRGRKGGIEAEKRV
jgi:hypothetical protein